MSTQTEHITNLRDMYSSTGFVGFQADKLGNNLFLSDPERAERIQTAAEHGADGSTHAEVIEDWREYLELIEGELSEEAAARIADEIDECEARHEAAGTLHEMVG